MSYSYIQSVFPNFQKSTISIENVYNNANIKQPELPKDIPPPEPININVSTEPVFKPVQVTTVTKPTVEFVPENQNQDSLSNFKKMNIVDNQSYLNRYKKITIPENQNTPVYLQNNIENFENDKQHQDYLDHIFKCSECKNTVIKHFNIENDKLVNEEIMEVVSYIAFCIFILLLIDNIKRV